MGKKPEHPASAYIVLSVIEEAPATHTISRRMQLICTVLKPLGKTHWLKRLVPKPESVCVVENCFAKKQDGKLECSNMFLG